MFFRVVAPLSFKFILYLYFHTDIKMPYPLIGSMKMIPGKMIKFRELLNQPFTLLDQVRYRLIFIAFCTFFSIFFVNVFVPFNINSWSQDSGWDQLVRLSGFGIILGLILVISQFGIRHITGIKHYKIGTFILWLFGEFLCMTVSFLFYQSSWDLSISQFMDEIPYSFKYTLLGILIPYSLSLLVISQIINQTKISQLKIEAEQAVLELGLMNFPDEKGIIRFSIAAEQLLYLESADNYVILFYRSGNKPTKQILRNSMKNIEGLFANSPLKRCHRSYMVNLHQIEFVDYEKTKCRVKLSGIENLIPVSRKFYPEIKPYVS